MANVRSDRAVKVDRIQTFDRIVSNNPFATPIEGKGGKLIVVYITLKNTGNESGNMAWSQFKLSSEDRDIQTQSDVGEGKYDSQPKVEANHSSTNNPQSRPVASPNSDKLTPDAAIVRHYRSIDNREIDKSWNDLSPSFKGSNLGKGFNEYMEWWNSVDKVYIGDVRVIKSSKISSVVKANLSYKLRSGRIMNDKKKYIYLVWTDGQWLIDGKSETYND
jgi:hypothetical protein